MPAGRLRVPRFTPPVAAVDVSVEFLRINNLPVSVLNGQANRKFDEMGGSRRWRGQWRDQRVRISDSRDYATVLMTSEKADALERWLLGVGDHWSCDEEFGSSRGNMPSAFSGSPTIVTPPEERFANPVNKAIQLLGGTWMEFTFAVDAAPGTRAYTVSRWVWNTLGTVAGWVNFIETYDDTNGVTRYQNGVVQGAALGESLITLGADTVVFRQRARNWDNTLDSDVYLEDVSVHPYRWTEDMVAAVSGSSARQPFGECPRVMLTGASTETSDPVEVMCELKDVSHEQGAPDAAFQQNLRRVGFTVHPV